MRIGVVDVGTNSTRLLVADVEGVVVELERRTSITRLGEGVDATGRLSEAAMARVSEALGAYRGVIDSLGASTVVAVATSAMRDADNGPAFREELGKRFGIDARTISGDEEARLTFRGATAARVPGGDRREGVAGGDARKGGAAREGAAGGGAREGGAAREGAADAGARAAGAASRGAVSAGGAREASTDRGPPTMLIDIGGGSTEYVLGRPGFDPSFHVSTRMGSVRHTERFLQSDPPAHGELAALAEDVRRVVKADVPQQQRAGTEHGIAVAGTATSLAAIDLQLDPYDPDRVHGHRVSLASCERMLAMLAALPVAERRRVTGLHPDRAPTIVAGALILLESIRAFGLDDIEVSEADILHGAALAAAEGAFPRDDPAARRTRRITPPPFPRGPSAL